MSCLEKQMLIRILLRGDFFSDEEIDSLTVSTVASIHRDNSATFRAIKVVEFSECSEESMRQPDVTVASIRPDKSGSTQPP